MNRKRKRITKPIIRTGDDPILKELCIDVKPDEDPKPIVQALLLALRSSDRCVGLAANQIGITKRVCVIKDLEQSRDDVVIGKVFINPMILDQSEETVTLEEACMSYPGVKAEIERNKFVTVQYLDENEMLHEEKLNAFESRVFQHEYDHLEGECILVKAVEQKLHEN